MKLLVSVSMQLTNVCTGHHELLAGHLACVFSGAPHFGRPAKGNCVQIYGLRLVFLS